MAWECAECNVRETDSTPIDSVCHHCGKPLCPDHVYRFADHAFAEFEGDPPEGRNAAHCVDCRTTYHQRVRGSARRR